MVRKKQPTPVLGSDARWEALRAQPKEALVALVRVLAPSAISPRRRLRSLRSRQPCAARTPISQRLRSQRKSIRRLRTMPTTEPLSGFSVTAPMSVQLRVWRDQRAGSRARASRYTA